MKNKWNLETIEDCIYALENYGYENEDLLDRLKDCFDREEIEEYSCIKLINETIKYINKVKEGK